ncbi:MAG TPA: hypothetical protein VFG15_14750 [Amycolatopsis sp.]|nr:hypothetical protein [Amycolatopsis sp.]
MSYGPITFVDEPGLLAVLRELLPEFRLYTRAELDAQYWRPDCLGKVPLQYSGLKN